MLTISLQYNSPSPKATKHREIFFLTLLTFGIYFSTYFALQCPIFAIPQTFSYNFLSNFVIAKTISIGGEFSSYDLALNFLANIKTLSADTTLAFSQSGLAHLLAISGGQVSIIINPLLYAVYKFFSRFLAKSVEPLLLMRCYFFFQKSLAFSFTLLIATAFGYTGALVRVIATFLFKQTVPLTMLFTGFESFSGMRVCYHTLLRCMLLVFLSCIYGNPFKNISFLLSYLGVELACISYSFTSKYLSHFSRNIFTTFLLHTATSSIIITIILYPVFLGHPFIAAMANMFALPLVNYLITPLTILVLLTPTAFFLQKYQIILLDFCLTCFETLARVFSTAAGANAFASPFLNLEESQSYLSFILIFIWTLLDLYHYLEQSLFKKLAEKSLEIFK